MDKADGSGTSISSPEPCKTDAISFATALVEPYLVYIPLKSKISYFYIFYNQALWTLFLLRGGYGNLPGRPIYRSSILSIPLVLGHASVESKLPFLHPIPTVIRQ